MNYCVWLLPRNSAVRLLLTSVYLKLCPSCQVLGGTVCWYQLLDEKMEKNSTWAPGYVCLFVYEEAMESKQPNKYILTRECIYNVGPFLQLLGRSLVMEVKYVL